MLRFFEERKPVLVYDVCGSSLFGETAEFAMKERDHYLGIRLVFFGFLLRMVFGVAGQFLPLDLSRASGRGLPLAVFLLGCAAMGMVVAGVSLLSPISKKFGYARVTLAIWILLTMFMTSTGTWLHVRLVEIQEMAGAQTPVYEILRWMVFGTCLPQFSYVFEGWGLLYLAEGLEEMSQSVGLGSEPGATRFPRTLFQIMAVGFCAGMIFLALLYAISRRVGPGADSQTLVSIGTVLVSAVMFLVWTVYYVIAGILLYRLYRICGMIKEIS